MTNPINAFILDRLKKIWFYWNINVYPFMFFPNISKCVLDNFFSRINFAGEICSKQNKVFIMCNKYCWKGIFVSFPEFRTQCLFNYMILFFQLFGFYLSNVDFLRDKCNFDQYWLQKWWDNAATDLFVLKIKK